jgi:hypothetical protein
MIMATVMMTATATVPVFATSAFAWWCTV